MITDGVEQDISLKQSSFSILKPKLMQQMVRIKGLQSKPELNGRYGFVDDFLRESERYRVLIPGRPVTSCWLGYLHGNPLKTWQVAYANDESCLLSAGVETTG